MKTLVYLLDLKDDDNLIKAYIEYHKNVWPEISKRLRQIGVHSNCIYRLDRRLISILSTDDSFDPVCDLSSYADDPICNKWDELMRGFQQKVPGAKDEEWWALTEPVFEFYSDTGE